MDAGNRVLEYENDMDKMFEDGNRLLSISEEYSNRATLKDITPREVQLLIKEADMVTDSYIGLSTNNFTQEDMNLDPKGTLLAASDDKRSIGRKIIDAAKKAILKLVSAYSKLTLKIIAYFSVSADAAKNLKEEIEKWVEKDENTWDNTAVLDPGDRDTIFEDTLGIRSIREYKNPNTATVVRYLAKSLSLSVDFKPSKKDIERTINLSKNITVPYIIDEDEDYDVKIISINKNKVRIMYLQEDVKDDYTALKIAFSNFNPSDDGSDIKAFDKVLTLSDVKSMLDTIHSASKDTGKSIDKRFKQIETAEKEFDKAAKEMKSKPSKDTKSDYYGFEAIYRATVKVSVVQSLDMVSGIKTGLKHAEIYFNAVKDAQKKTNT